MISKEKLYEQAGMSIDQLRELCEYHLQKLEFYLITYPWNKEYDLNKQSCMNFIEDKIFHLQCGEYIDDLYESKNTTHDEENVYIWFRDYEYRIHTNAIEHLNYKLDK